MSSLNLHEVPTPADVIIEELVSKINQFLPNLIEGVYLIGSIAQRDFHHAKSDIDFLILVAIFPTEGIVKSLKQIHDIIQRKWPKPDLSGCYLTMESLRNKVPESSKVLSYHEGSMRFGKFEMAPVALSELKSFGITVLGQEALTLPIHVEKDYLVNFVRGNLNSYWRNWVTNHSSYLKRKLILLMFPRFTEWAVLGVARQLYTLETGNIISKIEAGRYCVGRTPKQFESVIQQAMQIRSDTRTYPIVKSYGINPSFERLSRTIEFVNYIINLHCKKIKQ